MPSAVVLTASPSATSRTAHVGEYAAARLRAQGIDVEPIDVRTLPAEDLLRARTEAAAIRTALDRVARADGLVVASPIYKAAYTGALKAFLDVLPQDGLAGKVLLPVATGGTVAHYLALDYALRPVLAALGATSVLGGVFVVDTELHRQAGGEVAIAPEARGRLDGRLAQLGAWIRGHGPEALTG